MTNSDHRWHSHLRLCVISLWAGACVRDADRTLQRTYAVLSADVGFTGQRLAAARTLPPSIDLVMMEGGGCCRGGHQEWPLLFKASETHLRHSTVCKGHWETDGVFILKFTKYITLRNLGFHCGIQLDTQLDLSYVMIHHSNFIWLNEQVMMKRRFKAARPDSQRSVRSRVSQLLLVAVGPSRSDVKMVRGCLWWEQGWGVQGSEAATRSLCRANSWWCGQRVSRQRPLPLPLETKRSLLLMLCVRDLEESRVTAVRAPCEGGGETARCSN